MDLIKSLEWRYATKTFDSIKIVPQEALDVIAKAFSLTATSYGLQPVKLLMFQDKTLQKELVKYSMNQEQVAQASHILVFCIEAKIDENYIQKYFDLIKDIRDTPDAILKPFRDFLIEDFGKKTQKKINKWSTKQAYLIMGNLLTICALEGIDACPMEGFEPKQWDKLLKLKKRGLKSVLAMPIGYRAEDDMFAGFKKVRKPISESVISL